MNDFTMAGSERRATWALGAVFSLRMLGMFMVLPVLTTYGMSLAGASEPLIGVAIGIYGLTLIAALLAMTPALIWPADNRSLSRRLLPFFIAIAVIAAHTFCPCCAAATAFSTSSAQAAWICAMISPLAGFTAVKVLSRALSV